MVTAVVSSHNSYVSFCFPLQSGVDHLRFSQIDFPYTAMLKCCIIIVKESVKRAHDEW
jgi:hypothetical protein